MKTSNLTDDVKIIDKLGQPIEPGCVIAYGHALGRCAGIRIGKVLRVGLAQKQEYHHYGPRTRITVLGIDDDWQSKAPEICKRKGTLMFPDRIIVLDPEKLPEKFQSILDEIKVDYDECEEEQ